jgi:hypothetical protein
VQVLFLSPGGQARTTVELNPGVYAVTFKAAQRPLMEQELVPINVTVFGTSVGTVTPYSTNYGQYSTGEISISTHGYYQLALNGVVGGSAEARVYIDDLKVALLRPLP